MATDSKKYFTQKLANWHKSENDRSLPWKEEKDPYKIWLSEIILQQTRAEQGRTYYLRFIDAFPTICDLAHATDEVVFRLWQGLGYYNRCKNMLHTARVICQEYQGVFPNQYEKVLALKGVGSYTAAAISSFAFGLPYAVLDGNVYRVLSRYFGIETPIDSPKGKALFGSLAQELLNLSDPAAHNQAMMDLGASICSPKQSQCSICPLKAKCVAFASNLVPLLPIKQKKIKVSQRFFNFILLLMEDKVWIQRRTDQEIWQNLHQFYLIESAESLSEQDLLQTKPILELGLQNQPIQFLSKIEQRLTHQKIESKIYSAQFSKPINALPQDGFWVPVDTLVDYAFPKTLVLFLEQYFKL